MSEPTPTPPTPPPPHDDHISTSPHSTSQIEPTLPPQVSAPAGAPAIHAAEYAAAGAFHTEDPTHLKLYTGVFAALCVCTSLSFLINMFVGHGRPLSVFLIACVSVVKACLVAWIFMHLRADWRRVYGIMMPVCIMAVMMTIILSIDAALVWPHTEVVDPAAAAIGGHH
jgi:cytochrome c oxidase subunit IV